MVPITAWTEISWLQRWELPVAHDKKDGFIHNMLHTGWSSTYCKSCGDSMDRWSG